MLPVGLGRLPDPALELLDEITGGLETTVLGDLSDGKPGRFQKSAGMVTAKGEQVIGKAHAEGLFETTAEPGDQETRPGCHFRKRQGSLEIF